MTYLDWRVRLFSAAAVLAMIGMAFSVQWLVWIAVAFLLFAFLLRFMKGGIQAAPDESAGRENPH